MRAVDLKIARRLRDRGYLVLAPCPAHGIHPHDGRACLDCPLCRPADPCAGGCSNPDVHAEGGHDV